MTVNEPSSSFLREANCCEKEVVARKELLYPLVLEELLFTRCVQLL